MVQNIHKPEVNEEKVPNAKLLNIDFDLYTDGDQEFKIELIDLMISNLKEMQWSLGMDPEVFKKVCHKIKSTISILDCDILNRMIEDLNRADLKDRCSKANLINAMCDNIIKNLEEDSN